MKTKFNEFLNEDSFEGRRRESGKSSMIQEDEIMEIIQPFLDNFADEDAVGLEIRNDEIKIYLTSKYIDMMHVPEHDEEMINEFENLLRKVNNELYTNGYYYTKSYLTAYGFILQKD